MARIENGRQQADAVSIHTVGSQFDEESSFGSDSEINGFAYTDRQTDRYGFIGGAQKHSVENAKDVPPEVLRQREVKWLDMLNHWDKWLFKRHKKVRLRCQKGIPPSLRGRAWLYLSSGKVKKEQNKGKFKELDSMQGDPKWLDVIERDLHRQFPFHEMFVSRGGHGQQDLLRVLKAYTLYRPDEGYCQAQAPIAAVLLMHMPAEDAFWCLVQICERYLPGYYSAGLEAIQLDGEILFALLKRVCPVAYRHLDKHKIEPILYMTEWFMCAFSRTLPWASVLRVWDMFLCDGVKIIFRVGLALMRSMLGTKEKLKACQGQYETMELLRALEPRYMQEGYLVHQVLELPVSVRDVERENHVQLKRWRKKHGELSYKSAPRMHGALAVMAAEPHSRQDLYQNPTIVVQSPLDPSQSTPQLHRSKKRGTLRKNTKPIQPIVNPYALPTDPKAPASGPPPDTEDALRTDHTTPLLAPAPAPAPARSPSPSSQPQPHPPMFYQPPPQQPISSQPSPSQQPIGSHHSPPQQQNNVQPSVQQQQPVSNQPPPSQQPISSPPSPPQQPVTSQPQRQHPPMFYQPPQQPMTESLPTQSPPPTPSQTPPPPQQPMTESLPTQSPPPTPSQTPPPPQQPITESLPTQSPPPTPSQTPPPPQQPITESLPTQSPPPTPSQTPPPPQQPMTESLPTQSPPPTPSQTPPPPQQPMTESLPPQDPISEPVLDLPAPDLPASSDSPPQMIPDPEPPSGGDPVPPTPSDTPVPECPPTPSDTPVPECPPSLSDTPVPECPPTLSNSAPPGETQDPLAPGEEASASPDTPPLDCTPSPQSPGSLHASHESVESEDTYL